MNVNQWIKQPPDLMVAFQHGEGEHNDESESMSSIGQSQAGSDIVARSVVTGVGPGMSGCRAISASFYIAVRVPPAGWQVAPDSGIPLLW